MPRNVYFSNATPREQDLYEDIIIEAMKIYGVDVYYLPRKIINMDGVLNEDLISKYAHAFKIEMYLLSVEGFEGDGKFMSRFGLEVRDQVQLVVAKRRWKELVSRWAGNQGSPNEGDLIYFPITQTMFEIAYVDEKKPFFQLNDAYMWTITAETLEYEHSDIDTGIDEIDQLQTDHTVTFEGKILHDVGSTNFELGEDVYLTLPSGITGTAEFVRYQEIHESPGGLRFTIGPLSWDDGKFHTLEAGTAVRNIDSSASGVLTEIYNLEAPTSHVFPRDASFADNTTFAQASNLFIDFSETNPFGEPFEINP